MQQIVHLDFLPDNCVIEHKIQTAPLAEMQMIWSFLFIIGSIFLGISVQQQFPVAARYTSTAFVIYTIWILLTYHSYFVIDPSLRQVTYFNNVFFFGEKQMPVTSFDMISHIVAHSENEGFRNYLVIVYTKNNHTSAKRIHDNDSLELIHQYGTILAKIIGCTFTPFTSDKQLLKSQYQLNSFERQRGCLSTIGLVFLFATSVYIFYRYF
ncbi:hypothetical protein [Candidatus Uabimicrobium sp. HlEnr_7]|uniref:hypothetical protein n=1 Tax=Candidatus Uabimicrobium helgolandensis TaxID=3095367 RepID=UPI003556D1F7